MKSFAGESFTLVAANSPPKQDLQNCMACWHLPSNNRYGVRVVISIPPIFCVVALAVERTGKAANAVAERAEPTKRRRDIPVALSTIVLLGRPGYWNPVPGFHGVVGAVAAFSTSRKNIF